MRFEKQKILLFECKNIAPEKVIRAFDLSKMKKEKKTYCLSDNLQSFGKDINLFSSQFKRFRIPPLGTTAAPRTNGYKLSWNHLKDKKNLLCTKKRHTNVKSGNKKIEDVRFQQMKRVK